jgi:transcriptional regulator with XRE-family HTH domain
MLLAERIRKIRESNNLTQLEIAERCEMSSSAYGQIERKASQSSYETLKKIADSLGVSILFLLDVESNEYKEKNKL